MFNQWWLRLEHIAREAGLKLVVVVHHTGHANDRSRGTSAMLGNPDVLLSYTHAGNLGERPPNNLRYLSAIGRDIDLSSTEIDWEPDTNTLFCTNSGTTRSQAKSDVKAKQAALAVWNANERIKTGELYKKLAWRQDGRRPETTRRRSNGPLSCTTSCRRKAVRPNGIRVEPSTRVLQKRRKPMRLSYERMPSAICVKLTLS